MAAPSAQSLQIDAIAAEKETIIASDGFHAAKVAWVLLNAQTPGFTNFSRCAVWNRLILHRVHNWLETEGSKSHNEGEVHWQTKW